jgi:hypothetical protein
MLHHLRTHSKILLAITGVILMLTWLIFPVLSGLFDGRTATQGDYVKVTWRGGRLTAREMDHLRFIHAATVRFVQNVIRETLQRQGTPRAPGYSMISPNFQIGINPNGDDANLLQTELLAQRGKEMGVKVNDETVRNFLRKLSDYTITKDADFAALMEQAIHQGSGVTEGHVFDYLKKELMAQEVRLMLQAGIESFHPGELVPPNNQLDSRPAPAKLWSAFEKLNRKVTIEAYPLRVQDFVSKVTTEPKTSDLKKVFEEGRTRIPHPAMREPAFMLPHRVAFGWVKLDLQGFIDVAKKEITDEQVAQAYEEGKAKGEFKVEEPPPSTEENPGEKPADSKPEDQKPGETKPAEEKPAEDKPAEKPAETPKSEDNPADQPQADKPPEKEGEKSADSKQEPPVNKPAEPKENDGAALSSQGIQLVSFQEEGKQDETKPEEAKKDEPKKDEAPKEEPKATEPPSPGSPEAKEGEAKPAETKPAETAPADPAATPADGAAEKPVKFKPLEEVADQIRTDLARPIAVARRQKVLDDIQSALTSYNRQYSRWRAQETLDKELKKSGSASKGAPNRVEKPSPLDLSKVIEGTPVKLGETPLVDQNEIQETVDEKDPKDGSTKKVPKYEIAQASFFDARQFQQLTFAEIAFVENEPFYAPQTLPFSLDDLKAFGSAAAPEIWVYWRTDEVRARERTFEEAQKDVLKYWKEEQALKLAQAAAEELAAKAGQGKELKSLVPKPEEVVTPPAFSWYTIGPTGPFASGPVISNIEGIEYAGTKFRQAVYDLQVGQAGVAFDEPHRTVWVVRLLGEDGITDAARERFMATALDRDVLLVSYFTEASVKQDIYGALVKEYNIYWAPAKEDQQD